MGYIILAIYGAIQPQKAIKGQVVVDFLVDHPIQGNSKLYDDFPDEIVKVNVTDDSSEEQGWQLFFDGAKRTNPEGNIITGVRVVLSSPHNYVIPRAFSLTELCSNNVSEYNAFLNLTFILCIECHRMSPSITRTLTFILCISLFPIT